MKVRRIVLVVVGGLAGLFLLGVGLDLSGYVPPTDAPSAQAYVISGTFTLVDDATAANGCVGPSDGNWQDVHPGATVWVRSDLLSWSGSLGDGKVGIWGQYGQQACAYDFTVGVPQEERYTIDYPGGLSLDYTFAGLEADAWVVRPDCCNIVPGN